MNIKQIEKLLNIAKKSNNVSAILHLTKKLDSLQEDKYNYIITITKNNNIVFTCKVSKVKKGSDIRLQVKMKSLLIEYPTKENYILTVK